MNCWAVTCPFCAPSVSVRRHVSMGRSEAPRTTTSGRIHHRATATSIWFAPPTDAARQLLAQDAAQQTPRSVRKAISGPDLSRVDYAMCHRDESCKRAQLKKGSGMKRYGIIALLFLAGCQSAESEKNIPVHYDIGAIHKEVTTRMLRR